MAMFNVWAQKSDYDPFLTGFSALNASNFLKAQKKEETVQSSIWSSVSFPTVFEFK